MTQTRLFLAALLLLCVILFAAPTLAQPQPAPQQPAAAAPQAPPPPLDFRPFVPKTMLGSMRGCWAASSKSGKYFAQTAYGQLTLYDTTGWKGHSLMTTNYRVNSVNFSLDEKLLASADESGSVIVWNVATGEKVNTLERDPRAGATYACLDSAGQLLAAAYRDGSVVVWTLSGEKPTVKTLASEPKRVPWRLAFSPDGGLLAVGFQDGGLTLLSVANGQALHSFAAHKGIVWSLVFSPDGEVLASGGDDYLVKLWNPETGKSLKTLKGHKDIVYALAFSADGGQLASGSKNGEVKLWNPSNGKCVQTLPLDEDLVTYVAFGPKGDELYYMNFSGRMMTWPLPQGEGKQVLPPLCTGGKLALVFSPDGKTLATAGGGGDVYLYDLTEELKQPTSVHTSVLKSGGQNVWSLGYSTDGAFLAAGDEAGRLTLWQTATGQQNPEAKVTDRPLYALAFAAQDQAVLVGSNDNKARLIQANDGHCLHTYDFTSGVWSLALSPDGRRFAAGLANGGAAIIEVGTGALVAELKGHSGAIWGVAFSPDGKLLATASGDHTLKVWDAATGQFLFTLIGHTGEVTNVAFAPDSRLLASSAKDNTARLWDAQTGQALQTLSFHTAPVRSVAFSPDGKLLASASEDNTVMLWTQPPPEQVAPAEQGQVSPDPVQSEP